MRHGGARPLDDLSRSEARTGEITTGRRKQRHVEKKGAVCGVRVAHDEALKQAHALTGKTPTHRADH